MFSLSLGARSNALPSSGMGVFDGPLWFGEDEFVAQWVASRIPHMIGGGFGLRDLANNRADYVAIGVLCGEQFAGGVVFHDMHVVGGKIIDIRMSAAFEPKAPWGKISILKGLFHFPFVELGARRMTTITGRYNRAARKVDETLGFKLEGTVRRALDGTQDAMIYGMLREECRFIPKDARNGQ